MNMYQFFEQTVEKCPKTLFLVREKITFEELVSDYLDETKEIVIPTVSLIGTFLP